MWFGGRFRLAGIEHELREAKINRVAMVFEALIKAGVSSAAVKAGAFGQTHPAIMTADGVAEAGNRRVEILLSVK
jgi:outer membrane protein OmpA-like peptidoglycan-associated protein